MTHEQRRERCALLIRRKKIFVSSRAGVISIFLGLTIMCAGCTIADGFLSSNPTAQPIWTSTPTEGVGGTILPAPTSTETLPAVEAVPQTPTIKPALNVVEAVYLPFENGFMAYIEGASCLYAYAGGPIIPSNVIGTQMPSYMYCLPFDELPQAAEAAPEEPFGRIWSYYEEIPNLLGVQVGEAVRYTATIPRSDPVVLGGVFYSGMITLPNGQKLYCGTRAATAGTCQLRPP